MQTVVQFPGNLSAVEDLASLRQLSSTSLASKESYIVQGSAEFGDALGGIYAWDPARTTPDDGKTVIRPADRTPLQAGRWVAAVGAGTGTQLSVLTLADLKAADTTSGTVSLIETGNEGLFIWTPGDFTDQADDINVVKQDDVALSVGAWVRQAAGSISFGLRTVAERLGDTVSVKDFGAILDGSLHTVAEWIVPGALARFTSLAAVQAAYPHVTATTDSIDWAGSQAALNTGRSVFVPEGHYVGDTLEIKNGRGVRFTGAGPEQTLFEPQFPNKPVLRKEQSAGVVRYGYIGEFGVKAHSAGSTGPAIDCSGFRGAVRFESIFGFTKVLKGFHSLFDVSAAPYFTYGCTWDNCGLEEQTGWDNVWYFNNRGTVAANNANANIISNPWIYGNVGLQCGIDATRSAGVKVYGGLIEANTGAVAIRPGQGMTVEGMFLELNGTDFEFLVLADGAANGVTVRNNYISNPHTYDLSNIIGLSWYENSEAGVATFINNNGTNIISRPFNTYPVTPTLSRTDFGTFSAGPTVISAGPVTGPDRSHRVTYHLRHSGTPSATGSSQLTVGDIPTGWKIETIGMWATDQTTGDTVAGAMQSNASGAVWILKFASTNPHEIVTRFTLTPA